MLVSALPLSTTFAAGTAAEARLRGLFAEHFDFVWRSARRLGADVGAADDLAQEAFLVAARRLNDIEPGKEKAFLFGTVLRLIADARRKAARRREVPAEQALDDTAAHDVGPDARLDQARARAMLDRVIASLPEDTRPIFVLYEIEQMTMAEIAACLELPPGTVASRLRRAREAFAAEVARTQARATRTEVAR